MLSVGGAKTDSVPEPPKPKPLDIKNATRLQRVPYTSPTTLGL